MPTLLVIGQDVLRGYLPYENQFEPKGPLLLFHCFDSVHSKRATNIRQDY